MVREPDNRHDRYAVKVCDVEQRHLGYIPRELAAQLASQLDNLQQRGIIASCNAKVWGNDRNYGIWLDLDLTELLSREGSEGSAPLKGMRSCFHC